jgi:hypothetical protein
MGTRSTIALEFADGTVEQVYCHWDGYLSHNGRILAEHYSDPFKLRDLIDLGDLSSLRPEIGNQHAFSQFELRAEEVAGYKLLTENMCTFYGRDRNESGVGAKKFKDFEDYKANHQYEEFEYILRACGDKAVWFVASYRTNGEYELLAAALAKEAETETA